MKIVICCSLQFAYEVKEIADKLEKEGHNVEIPWGVKKILSGKLDYDKFMKEKEKKGDTHLRKIAEEDLIIRYYKLIKNSDAILVANHDKKEIKNYIGGNTFLEMGFAYVMDKKIYLLNDIPDMLYTDELKAMDPIIINDNLAKIK